MGEYKGQNEEKQIVRVNLPKKGEIIGVVEQRLGGNKMMVGCLDGVERNCRVPGRLRRKLWLRQGDIVIVKPWDLDNQRGDIVYKYNHAQVAWLRKKGYLKEETEEF